MEHALRATRMSYMRECGRLVEGGGARRDPHSGSHPHSGFASSVDRTRPMAYDRGLYDRGMFICTGPREVGVKFSDRIGSLRQND